MPCNSGPGSRSDYAGWYLHDGETAALLCSVLQTAEKEKWLGKLSLQVRAWWAEHKERDKRRVMLEMKEAKSKKDKAAALSKLTPYERELLGIERRPL